MTMHERATCEQRARTLSDAGETAVNESRRTVVGGFVR
jgi:hypothetical protein